jgi:tetratricopeptide (TPR) repeat protein
MPRWLRVAVAAALLPVCVSAAGPARADGKDPRAMELFEKSETAYDQGRFAEAIALLRQAYALEKEPVLLYNLGRAYEGLGDLAGAAQAYEDFLRAQPDAPDRGALERRIGTLRRQLTEREALRRKAAAEKPRTASPIPWIVAGVGAGGLAAGGLVGVLASNKHDDAVREPTYREADRLESQAKSMATAANVCLVAGGVLLVVGVVWGILDVSASRRASGAAEALRVTF